MKILFYRVVSLIIIALVGFACAKADKLKIVKAEPYAGPQVVTYDLNVVHTDSAKLSMKMKAKKQVILQNEDQEFSEGFALQFYNEKEEVYSTLNSKYAYYEKALDRWKIRGDVVVENTEKGQKLETQELFWMPTSGDILVEDQHAVKITEPDQILTGFGLKAKDDFSYYKIKKPKGMKFL